MPPPPHMPNILRGPGDYDVTSLVHNDTYPEIDPAKMDFSGKSVFITGGSRGLGRSMALSFAKAGASRIAVGARSNMDQLAKDIELSAVSVGRKIPQFLPVEMNVTVEESVANAAAQVEAAFGSLDVLVNNAGILGKYGLIGDSDSGSWWEVMETNLRGPYLVTRAFLPLVLKSQSRYIINVVSVGAHLTNPTLSAYQISKLGLMRMTQLTNVEYGESHGLTAISIHPGNCPTEIMGGPENIPPHHRHVFVETPELSADSIVYLTSERRPWLGGRYINCTWHLPELLDKKDDIVAGDKLKTKFDFEIAAC